MSLFCYAIPASVRNFSITQIIFVASSRYLLKALTTANRKSSKVRKYFRCVASFLVFLHNFSMGFLSGGTMVIRKQRDVFYSPSLF